MRFPSTVCYVLSTVCDFVVLCAISSVLFAWWRVEEERRGGEEAEKGGERGERRGRRTEERRDGRGELSPEPKQKTLQKLIILETDD